MTNERAERNRCKAFRDVKIHFPSQTWVVRCFRKVFPSISCLAYNVIAYTRAGVDKPFCGLNSFFH